MPELLLVDDDPVWTGIVRAFLGRHKFNVDSAVDGPSALPKILSHRPDLILLDLILPGVGGLDLLLLFQRDPSLARIPVVVVTARADAEAAHQTIDLGARAHMVKSQFSLKDLLETVTRVLDEESRAAAAIARARHGRPSGNDA